MRGREFIEPGFGDRLEFADQLDLRRTARRKNQIADLVRDGEHLLQDFGEIQRGRCHSFLNRRFLNGAHCIVNPPAIAGGTDLVSQWNLLMLKEP